MNFEVLKGAGEPQFLSSQNSAHQSARSPPARLPALVFHTVSQESEGVSNPARAARPRCAGCPRGPSQTALLGRRPCKQGRPGQCVRETLRTTSSQEYRHASWRCCRGLGKTLKSKQNLDSSKGTPLKRETPVSAVGNPAGSVMKGESVTQAGPDQHRFPPRTAGEPRSHVTNRQCQSLGWGEGVLGELEQKDQILIFS